ncbi:dehydratase [Gammaproteobacteria bacterium 45_16_T64]|nr:dehydratase [Gammaproteobacteria bacterium 45_16_T64]
MENYTIETIALDQSHDFQVKIYPAMVDAFTELSGDINPLHTSKTFAMEKGFHDRVVYGMLTASFYSTLIGVFLPGRNALLQELDTTFRKPVFIGDELTVHGRVIDINTRLSRIEVQASITNQIGQKVSKARIKAGIYAE